MGEMKGQDVGGTLVLGTRACKDERGGCSRGQRDPQHGKCGDGKLWDVLSLC